MLSITHTENFTGALISGDFWDLDEFNHAIYMVIGDENKYYDWEGSRKRILSVLIEIKNASKANRHVSFVGNGLNKETMKLHEIVGSEKNIYFSVQILWPELIFTVIALNDFVHLYSNKHNYAALDVYVTSIRKFQSVVGEALQSVMSKEQHDQFMNLLSENKTNVQEYAIQFVDVLNLNHINSTKEQREKSLGMIALKLAIQDKDYHVFQNQVLKSANETKSDIHDLSITKDYPKEIEW
jgi:hypothetical protein